MNSKIKVITYNTCWETQKPTRTNFGKLGLLCSKNPEKCRKNVANVLNNNKPFDFIALQEVVFKKNSPKILENMVIYWDIQL